MAIIPGLTSDTIEIGIDIHHDGPGGNTDLGQYLRVAIDNTRHGRRTRLLFHGEPLALIIPDRLDGPDVLDASVRGAGLPEMREAALAKARELYGDEAGLRVERASKVWSYASGAPFGCTFTIRCTDFPAEEL
jgi:hypothetical protein